jgi:hypothetical protein
MPACGWEIIGCQDCAPFSNLDPAVQAEVEAWAINRLWLWTNQRFGQCPVSYRPCRKTCNGYAIGGPWLIGGRFLNLTCGICGDECSCTYVSQVILPGPIWEPTEILIDGDPLDLDAVQVYDYNKLVRIDGGHFPTCQNLGATPFEVGTWQVTYLQGEPIPAGGQLVAGILAQEYAKAICGDGSCRLPKRLSSITRQGMTIAMLDNFTNLKEGFTGIWEIDDWIMSAIVPPARSTVFSPDVPRPKQPTWTFSESS